MKNPRDYLNPEKSLTSSTPIVTEKDLAFEFMLNALRLTNGVPTHLFSERTGLAIESLAPILQFAREKELLVNDKNKLCATEMGQRFLNDVISLFLPKNQ